MDDDGGERMSALTHFLIVFDRATSRLVSKTSYSEEEDAMAEFSKAERANYGNEDIEVVLLSADSIETLEKTHGHYFSGKDEKTNYVKLLNA
jgi:hypothetical protein